MVPKALSRNPCNLSWKWESKRCGQVASFTTFHNLHLNFQTSCAQRATKTRKKLKRSKWATSTLCKMCCGDPAPLKQSKPLSILGVALGCRASAIIYSKTRVYGDYQWIIAINASIRPLTLQPIATPNLYAHRLSSFWEMRSCALDAKKEKTKSEYFKTSHMNVWLYTSDIKWFITSANWRQTSEFRHLTFGKSHNFWPFSWTFL